MQTPSPIAPGTSGRPLAVIVRTLLRLLIIAVLVAAPIALPALAAASPPDPSWVAGLYDQGDCDDVVILIESTAADVEPAAPTAVSELPPLNARVAEAIDAACPFHARSVVHPRAPPRHA